MYTFFTLYISDLSTLPRRWRGQGQGQDFSGKTARVSRTSQGISEG